ncbi:TerC family protein [Brevibacillus sp. SYSU BS000544]|uniref:TerC family protein n=1 Tax=Brevibacillus sp. SYSU BS000544 TaxID=3416443 RepID=UPI003CE4D752
MMEWLTANWSALVGIIIIDMILSGDNAVVIAMAARNLPKNKQKQAMFFGTFGAIAMRILFAGIVVFLIKIPLLKAVGGLLLLHIAYKLLIQGDEEGDIKGGATLMAAIGTIIYADVLMSLDNVLAVAGVSHGNILLIAIGVLISIPIILIGSAIILSMIEKFPIITYIGSGILAWTAGGMIVGDKWVQSYISGKMGLIFTIAVTVIVIVAGWLKNRKSRNEESAEVAA